MPKWIIQTSRLLSFLTLAIGTVGLTEEEAQQTYGKENIKVYTSQFASMYTAVTQHRQQAKIQTHHCWSRGKGRWPSWSWLRSR